MSTSHANGQSGHADDRGSLLAPPHHSARAHSRSSAVLCTGHIDHSQAIMPTAPLYPPLAQKLNARLTSRNILPMLRCCSFRPWQDVAAPFAVGEAGAQPIRGGTHQDAQIASAESDSSGRPRKRGCGGPNCQLAKRKPYPVVHAREEKQRPANSGEHPASPHKPCVHTLR